MLFNISLVTAKKVSSFFSFKIEKLAAGTCFGLLCTRPHSDLYQNLYAALKLTGFMSMICLVSQEDEDEINWHPLAWLAWSGLGLRYG